MQLSTMSHIFVPHLRPKDYRMSPIINCSENSEIVATLFPLVNFEEVQSV